MQSVLDLNTTTTQHTFNTLSVISEYLVGQTMNNCVLYKNCTNRHNDAFHQRGYGGYKSGATIKVKRAQRYMAKKNELDLNNFTDEEKSTFVDGELPIKLTDSITQLVELDITEMQFLMGQGVYGNGIGIQNNVSGLNAVKAQLMGITEAHVDLIETEVANQYYRFPNLLLYGDGTSISYAELPKIGGSAAGDPAYPRITRKDMARIQALFKYFQVNASDAKIHLDLESSALLAEEFQTLDSNRLIDKVAMKGYLDQYQMVHGMHVGGSTHIATHTTGDYDAAVTPTLDTSGSSWSTEYVTHKDTVEQTIVLDNCRIRTGAVANSDSQYTFLKQGDMLQLKGVYKVRTQGGDVNLGKSKISMPFYFTVLEDSVTTTAIGTTFNNQEVKVSSPIIEDGSYQNMYTASGTLPASNEVQFIGAPGVERKESLNFAPEALALVCVPLAAQSSGGVVSASYTAPGGLGVSISQGSNVDNLQNKVRIDGLYGVASLDTERRSVRRFLPAEELTTLQGE